MCPSQVRILPFQFMVEIPKISHDDGFDYTEGHPGWHPAVSSEGKPIKPIIRCNCGWFCGIALHHVHPDGTVTASFFHTPECDPGRGCGWHVHLKLKDWDGGEFLPGQS